MSQVSSPVAQRVLTVLRYEVLKHNHRPGESYYPLGGMMAEYRDWVRARLEKSNIAQRLPHGLEAFPDIWPVMPLALRTLEHSNRPHGLGPTVMHLLRNLEWYLDEKRQRRRPPVQFWPLAATAACLTGIVVTLSLQTGFDALIIIGLLCALGFSLLPLINLQRLHQTGGLLNGEHPLGEKHMVNAIELYNYLADAYNDPPKEAETATVMTSNSALVSSDHATPQSVAEGASMAEAGSHVR